MRRSCSSCSTAFFDVRSPERTCCEMTSRPSRSRRPMLMPPPKPPSKISFRSWIAVTRSEEHTSELQSLMRISYAVFCLKKNTRQYIHNNKLWISIQKYTSHYHSHKI